jgi:hypothetical protein
MSLVGTAAYGVDLIDAEPSQLTDLVALLPGGFRYGINLCRIPAGFSLA